MNLSTNIRGDVNASDGKCFARIPHPYLTRCSRYLLYTSIGPAMMLTGATKYTSPAGRDSVMAAQVLVPPKVWNQVRRHERAEEQGFCLSTIWVCYFTSHFTFWKFLRQHINPVTSDLMQKLLQHYCELRTAKRFTDGQVNGARRGAHTFLAPVLLVIELQFKSW